ncbi:MAG: protease SohB [Gammaproteobacteria bacterium]|nr:protease SohB [Gammaproteobacteria bacterium]
MEFLSEYGLFLAKTLTWVIAVLAATAGVLALAARGKDQDDKGEITVTRYNDEQHRLQQRIHLAMLPETDRKAAAKADKAAEKTRKADHKKALSGATPKEPERARRIFVLDFDGDLRASHVESLRHTVTATLMLADPQQDEVMVRLESPGGMVHAYGLAAAQLDRIRRAGLPLTACVDKVAASGGYLMACVADRIQASPFAIIGSIGVVAQLPNFHRLLKKHDIDYEILTAGEYKRTLTMFGENTDKGRQKFLDDLQTIHVLFKQYVGERRTALDLEAVANGDIWLGSDACRVGLVDGIGTSDEWLAEASNRGDVLVIDYVRKRSLPERLGLAAATGVERSVMKVVSLISQSRYSA